MPQEDRDTSGRCGPARNRAGPPVSIKREDLPSTVEELRADNIDPIVLIWSTELNSDEFKLDLQPLAAFDHYDHNKIFGCPTLSFLSRTGPFWESIPKRTRAVYDERYSTIAEEYFEGLRRSGYDITTLPVRGDIGKYFRIGMADIGIGIVTDETLIAESRTWPLDRILKGEPVLAYAR